MTTFATTPVSRRQPAQDPRASNGATRRGFPGRPGELFFPCRFDGYVLQGRDLEGNPVEDEPRSRGAAKEIVDAMTNAYVTNRSGERTVVGDYINEDSEIVTIAVPASFYIAQYHKWESWPRTPKARSAISTAMASTAKPRTRQSKNVASPETVLEPAQI